MGNQSNMKVVLRLVFILLLLSVSLSALESECPEKCECDEKEFQIRCSNANLVKLPKGPFPFHRKLKVMDLSFNRIGILKKQMFADQEIYTLKSLTMANNTISSMEPETFRGVPTLEYLDLSNNDIYTFNPTIFEDVQSLKTLIVHHNPYLQLAETGYDLPELSDLIMNNCMIKTVPSNFFNKLTNLEKINLSNNLIEHFDSKIISGLTNLQHIDLSSNKLYLLHEVVYQLPISLNSIKLSSNAWACNCEIKEAVAIYEKGSYNKSSIIVCSSPEGLINETVNEELVKRITCTTTTEETTSASTTELATVDQDLVQNDQANPDSDVESININTDNINAAKMGNLQSYDQVKELSQSETEGDKSNDVQLVKQAGWYTNWMVYGAVALVLTTSVVVFFVKHQVTKHMQRPGNVLDRKRQEFGGSKDGYLPVAVSAV